MRDHFPWQNWETRQNGSCTNDSSWPTTTELTLLASLRDNRFHPLNPSLTAATLLRNRIECWRGWYLNVESENCSRSCSSPLLAFPVRRCPHVWVCAERRYRAH